MSEYQYYEFQALDRRLNEAELKYVDALSSRVQLSPTRAIFVYNYSDLPTREDDLLFKCFDALLYMANWGTRRLLFRFPHKLVDYTALEQYCIGDAEYELSVERRGDYVLLNMTIYDET